MGSTRHEESFVDYEHPYEQNIIGLKGIVYFGVGLFLLIVITFGLMWALMNVLEDDAKTTKGSTSRMGLSDTERLPPEPRLQGAPGFGVDSAKGRVNMELQAPQSEWWEIERQYRELWDKGRKDAASGAVTALSIKDAKERFLAGAANTAQDPQAAEKALRSRMYFSDSSSGRKASEKRR